MSFGGHCPLCMGVGCDGCGPAPTKADVIVAVVLAMVTLAGVAIVLAIEAS